MVFYISLYGREIEYLRIIAFSKTQFINMFSALLPKPKHTEYYKPLRFEQVDVSNRSILVLPQRFEEVQEVIKETGDDTFDKKNTISKYYLNKDGSLNYNMTIAASNGNNRFHGTYEDTIPLKKRFPNLKHSFPKYDKNNCPDDTIEKCIEETKAVINKMLNNKEEMTGKNEPQFVNYKTSELVGEDRGRNRNIQITNYQQDPMLPPQHKLRKNRHTETSPPPPILKNTSGSVKLTKEEHAKWNIPAAVSNWKNNQGFTISLDKRMKAASSSDLPPEVNLDKLASLSSALDDADKQAREDIRLRNEIRKEMAEKQQIEKQQKLQELAQMTRNKNKRRNFYDNDDAPKRSRY